MGWGCILIGGLMLFNSFARGILQWLSEYFGYDSVEWMWSLYYKLPQMVAAILIILLGVHFMRGGKKNISGEEITPYHREESSCGKGRTKMNLNEKPADSLPEDTAAAESTTTPNQEQPCREQPPEPVNPQPPVRGWVSADPPPKEIRVGRITLGLALIAMGILLLIGLFNPGFSIMAAAKCAPVILIFIGVEILVSTFLAKGRQIKYDFLSMFVCCC